MRIMTRMLDFQSSTKSVSPVPSMRDGPAAPGINNTEANEMGQVTHRLFTN